MLKQNVGPEGVSLARDSGAALLHDRELTISYSDGLTTASP